VADLDFGLELSEDSVFAKTLRHSKKTDYISSRLLLRQAYANTFGIFDYLKQEQLELFSTDAASKRPLAMMALHPAEDHCKGSRIYELIKLFPILKIYQHYGMSLTDFLELPHDYADLILTESSNRYKKDAEQNESLINKLKRNAGPES
jgi:hypothetical protein